MLFIGAELGLGKSIVLLGFAPERKALKVRQAACAEVGAWLPFGLLDRLFGELGMLGSGGAVSRVRLG